MHYLLSASSRPRRLIADAPWIEGVGWWRGVPITVPVPRPLAFSLAPYRPWSGDEDQYLAAIMGTNPPLWRDDLVQALRDCGVDNFETYEVAIANPDNTAVVEDFHRQLREAGVDDVDGYLRGIGHERLEGWIDPRPGAVFTGYKAVNVLGLVAAADLGRSQATVHDGVALADVDFDHLALDDSRTHGLRMFRLAESTNAIVVHESVRDALLDRGFGPDLAFHDLGQAAI